MPYDLSTLRGTPSFAGAGKFSTCLSGGVLSNASAHLFLSATGANGGALSTGTVEGWVKISSPGATKVAFGAAQWFWVGCDASGNATANYGASAASTTLTSSAAIADGAWHHVAFVLSGGAGSLHVDGARVATSAVTRSAGSPAGSAGFCVGGFGTSADASTGFDWTGSVDEVRLSTTARYASSTYTTPTAVFTRDGSTRALYHLDSDGADDASQVAADSTSILYSPYNWHVAGGVAETINAGAYLRVELNATPTALTFDMTNVSSPVPQIAYRIDQGPWQETAVASSVALTAPSNPWPTHLLEVVVKATTYTANRWNSPRNSTVKLTGIVGATAATLPESRALSVLVYGDSIAAGRRTINATATNDTDQDDSRQGWAYLLRDVLGCEVGVVGFGGQGIVAAGAGNVPALPSSYDLLWAGQARSFASEPDVVVVNMGTNDGATDTTTAMTGFLDDLLTDCPTARVVVLRPFNGTAQATYLQAAVAASIDPARVAYVDTAGWWSASDSGDSLHPYGYANVSDLAPLVAASVRDALAAGATYVNVGGSPKRASLLTV